MPVSLNGLASGLKALAVIGELQAPTGAACDAVADFARLDQELQLAAVETTARVDKGDNCAVAALRACLEDEQLAVAVRSAAAEALAAVAKPSDESAIIALRRQALNNTSTKAAAAQALGEIAMDSDEQAKITVVGRTVAGEVHSKASVPILSTVSALWHRSEDFDSFVCDHCNVILGPREKLLDHLAGTGDDAVVSGTLVVNTARSWTRTQMTEIYKEHNPDKLENISELLRKYNGSEEELYSKLCKKYGVVQLRFGANAGEAVPIQANRPIISLDNLSRMQAADGWRCQLCRVLCDNGASSCLACGMLRPHEGAVLGETGTHQQHAVASFLGAHPQEAAGSLSPFLGRLEDGTGGAS